MPLIVYIINTPVGFTYLTKLSFCCNLQANRGLKVVKFIHISLQVVIKWLALVVIVTFSPRKAPPKSNKHNILPYLLTSWENILGLTHSWDIHEKIISWCWSEVTVWCAFFNTLRPGKNGRHFGRRHFQIQIRQWKCFHFGKKKITEVCS